ncbi:hypothetical protein BLD44_029630 [Mastigocladus laminosus UU774]|nr:hypothetical protein BLD44_029630 [Mastigocladus laminosus UU774]
MLELTEGKLSWLVLRGGDGGNAIFLPDLRGGNTPMLPDRGKYRSDEDNHGRKLGFDTLITPSKKATSRQHSPRLYLSADTLIRAWEEAVDLQEMMRRFGVGVN